MKINDTTLDDVRRLIDAEAQRDYANRNNLLYLIKKVVRLASREELDGCFACKVVSVNRKDHSVVVLPLSRRVLRNNEGNKAEGITEDRYPISCSLWQFAAGLFVIDLPVRVGDVGWCIAGDRDFSYAKQEHDIQNARSLEAHRFEFGFFIPDYWGVVGDAEGEPNLSLYDKEENRLVISTFDGSQRISVGQRDIKIFSTNTTINTTSDCTINTGAATRINANGEVVVKAKGGASVEAASVSVKAATVKMDTDMMTVTGGVQAKAAATGTISASTVAQVKDGLIVSIAT